MTEPFFPDVPEPIPYEGPDSDNPLAFRYYDADRVVGDKTMAEHLRMAVCYWHSFAWGGNDVFGQPTFDRPWIDAATGSAADQLAAAKHKMAAAFEFFNKLGVEYYCFHDADIAPPGATFVESRDLLGEMIDEAQSHMDRTGTKLLWGTANLFSHPRYMAGAATNPDPEVFAYAAATVKNMLDQTHRLGGENYVLWGGREGYETLLNTDMGRETQQLARFMHLVVDHARSIGFDGTILIEPKPQEPTKHQYDYDSATVHAFLVANGLADDIKVNIEVNHATLGGHSFEHEIAYATAHGILGSVDANRGDPQNGWDTDQFPNSVEEMSLALYRILRAGGLGSGGFNFDTKLRRQSIGRNDLFHGHIGGMDTLARSLLVAHAMVEDGALDGAIEARYAGWSGDLGGAIHDGSHTLATLEALVEGGGVDPAPVSGGQERLENLVNRYIAAN